MAGSQPTRRSAAATAAEEDEEEKPTPDEEEKPEGEGEEDGDEEPDDSESSAEGETPADEEEEDEEAKALAKSHGAVLARIRSRAAAKERTRIAGIRALGRAGQEAVVQACIEDASCSIEKAALKLLQHEGEKRGAHLRGIRREEQALDAPDNRAAPEAGGDAAIAGSIVALFHQHNPKRRPATAGRA